MDWMRFVSLYSIPVSYTHLSLLNRKNWTKQPAYQTRESINHKSIHILKTIISYLNSLQWYQWIVQYQWWYIIIDIEQFIDIIATNWDRRWLFWECESICDWWILLSDMPVVLFSFFDWGVTDVYKRQGLNRVIQISFNPLF